MTDTDFSVNGETAYVSGTTGPQHNINKIATTLVFTPNFTYDAADDNNGASQVTLFQIRDPQNATGSLLSVDLFVSKYLGRDELDLSSNFQYGDGVQTGAGMQSYTTTPAYGSINKLSGDTLTLQDTETFDFSHEDANLGGVVISNYGTLSDSTGLLYTYDFAYTSRDNTVSSDIDGSNFNPPDDNLAFNAGIVVVGANPDFLQPGASVTFSEVNVTVPEPSTYAFLGLGALALFARRSPRAAQGLIGFCSQFPASLYARRAPETPGFAISTPWAPCPGSRRESIWKRSLRSNCIRFRRRAVCRRANPTALARPVTGADWPGPCPPPRRHGHQDCPSLWLAHRKTWDHWTWC